jgi:UDP-N-acetylglucosamine 1-carboxyvinyltransferase
MDVSTTLKLLRQMGATAERSETEPDCIHLDAGPVNSPVAPYELVKTMRASILVLGPLLARFGVAVVSLPGGCAIGSRPVDQHIKGLQAMGAHISVERGNIIAKTTRLKGARITTDMVTVTGTENLLDGRHAWPRARRCWRTPRRSRRCRTWPSCSISMGARIEGHGTSRIRIEGVDALHAPRARAPASSPTASRPAPSCARWPPRAATSRCAARAPTTWTPCWTSCARPGCSIEDRAGLDPRARTTRARAR